jgi:hypothetical protein
MIAMLPLGGNKCPIDYNIKLKNKAINSWLWLWLGAGSGFRSKVGYKVLVVFGT